MINGKIGTIFTHAPEMGWWDWDAIVVVVIIPVRTPTIVIVTIMNTAIMMVMGASAVRVEDRRSVPIMFPEMSVQIRLLPKGPVTEGTAERLLFVMNVTDVALEVGGD
jgi:hypothetical protein